jgi:hypothetical protein
MLVGQGRAGKTAFRNALSGIPFVDTPSTIGVETLDMRVTQLDTKEASKWAQVSVSHGEELVLSQAKLAALNMRLGDQQAAPATSVLHMLKQRLPVAGPQKLPPTAAQVGHKRKSSAAQQSPSASSSAAATQKRKRGAAGRHVPTAQANTAQPQARASLAAAVQRAPEDHVGPVQFDAELVMRLFREVLTRRF